MAKKYGSSREACPFNDSSISVTVVDSRKKAVGDVAFSLTDSEGKAQEGTTDTKDGVAKFKPFRKGAYKLEVKLKEEQKKSYDAPAAKNGAVGAKEEAAVIKLKLQPNKVTPKLAVEKAKAWLDKAAKSCQPVEVELYLEEDKPALKYKGNGKLKRGSADLRLYSDAACKKPLQFNADVATISNADLRASPHKKVYAKGSGAGKLSLTLELEPAKEDWIQIGSAATGAVEVIAVHVAPAAKAVVVKKPHTKPARISVKLGTSDAFEGNGTFTRSSDALRLFTAAKDGKEIAFDGKDNVFSGAQLKAGVELFVQGAKASAAPDDLVLGLELPKGASQSVPSCTAKMTAVELTLDVFEPRTSPGADPPLLPQPPETPAATPSDKFNPGRPLALQDADKHQERALLLVRQAKPAAFTGKLVLARLDDKVQAFKAEDPKAPKATGGPIADREVFEATKVPAAGRRFFVEALKESAKAGDTGFVLGIQGVEDEGDRIAMTALHSEVVSDVEPKDLPAARVAEKPARTTKSKYTPPPLFVGVNYEVRVRPFIHLGKMSAFAWTGPATVKVDDADKEIAKLTPTTVSAAAGDRSIEAMLTTELGKLKLQHRFTAVKAELDPVTSGDKLNTSSDINAIVNPSGMVILTGADADDPKKVPRYKITKITPDLKFKDEDDRIAWWIVGGQAAPAASTDPPTYQGKAKLLDKPAEMRGKVVQAFGETEGDVLLQPYSGGFAYGMFRATVVPIKQVKYRVNRIFTKAVAASGATPARVAKKPTATHAAAKKHMQVANIYLRQAGIELIPDDSAEAASSAGNAKVGLATLDANVVAVTKVEDGHFDVEVGDVALTFGATKSDSISAIQINARNEIVSFAYMHSEAGGSALATARLCPANHAPKARNDPPRAYTKADYTLEDNGTPSSSLIPKTGMPGDTPVDPVKMIVLFPDVTWLASDPGSRDERLLWGISVPTTSIDTSGSVVAGKPDTVVLAYANTMAHEVGHVLGLGHRGDLSAGVPDGLAIPAKENLMQPDEPPPKAENLDLIQVKAIRFSEVMFRTP
jgi:hypothetical protein